MEAVQQQSFPITEARLISPATRPFGRSQPNTPVVLAISLVGGLFFAFGAALLVEISDRGFRTAEQVERILRADCIAVLPLIKQQRVLPQPTDAAGDGETPRTLDRRGLLSVVVDEPFSRFTEAIRSIKVAADLSSLDKPIRTIGITSTLPNEGKSTIAANFANLIGHSGRSVILVDGDLRNPSLSRALAPQADAARRNPKT
jgi:succinoglycan biosynthesis transport protein ExoP